MSFRQLVIIVSIAFVGGLSMPSPFAKRHTEIITETKTDTIRVYPELNDRSLLILSMMWVESNFSPDATGKHSDTGILQITPVYVDEVNRILGCERYSIEDAYDLGFSLDMFDILQGRYNPDNDFMSTIYYHNKSESYRDKVILTYNKFLAYESLRREINNRYQK